MHGRRVAPALASSIVKQIVDRLDGQVNCEDAPGGGTIFHVELPTWAHAVKAQSHLDRISDRRILLCEDDPEVAVTLGDRLLQEGFLVDIAFTASEAVAHVAAASYTAILVDLQRPEGVDIDLIKQLRKQPQIYNTLLVALSTDLKQPHNEERPPHSSTYWTGSTRRSTSLSWSTCSTGRLPTVGARARVYCTLIRIAKCIAR